MPQKIEKNPEERIGGAFGRFLVYGGTTFYGGPFFRNYDFGPFFQSPLGGNVLYEKRPRSKKNRGFWLGLWLKWQKFFAIF